MMHAGDNQIYCAIPSKANARVYVPLATGERLVDNLRVYEPGSVRARLFKVWLLSMPSVFQYQYLKRNRVSNDLNRKLSDLIINIQRELAVQNEIGSIYQGTSGPCEKLTIVLNGHDRGVGYIKVAEKAEAKRLVRQEFEILKELNTYVLKSAKVPEPYLYKCDTDITWLYQWAPRSLKYSSNYTHSTILKYLKETSQRHRQHKSLNEIVNSNKEGYLTEEERYLLKRLLHLIEAHWKVDKIITHFAHGDFSPWNLRNTHDGKLYVFDWEYGASDYPALFDLFHYLIMPALLIKRVQPIALASNILHHSGYRHKLVAEAAQQCEVPEKLIPAYLSLYLWHMIDRGIVVDKGRRIETQLSKNSAFRRMLHYIIIEHDAVKKRKVLVSAYACEPNRGSEPGVGWNMVQAIGKNNVAWVVTRKNNQSAIESFIRNHPLENIHFIYTDLPKWASLWKKGGRGIRTYYYLWQFAALIEVLRSCRRLKWDVAHHVTFVNDWLFTFLALLPGRFIWGPIGSHPRIPRGLSYDWKQAVKDGFRCGFQTFMRYIDPLYWLSVSRSSIVVGISKDVLNRGPLKWKPTDRKKTHTAIGIEDEYYQMVAENKPTISSDKKLLDIVSIGRLIPIKGFHLAIEGFAKFINRGGQGRLEIIGKGPEETHLKNLVKKLGISEHVAFTAWMKREDVIQRLRKADVFLYPSFESGGIVLLEAMSSGIPVIVSAVGGPGEIAADDAGIIIETKPRNQFTEEIAQQLAKLAKSREYRERVAIRGRQRIRQKYLWSQRSEVVDSWYSMVIDRDV